MKMASLQCVVFAFLAILPVFISGSTCRSPKVDSRVYTTTDATVSLDTAFVVEFSLQCQDNIQDINLYAELNGQALPASKILGSGKNSYQVSYSSEHKNLPAGNYVIRFFDEEGYSTLRKAQRSGDDITAVKSLFNIEVNHPGTTSGMYVQSEFIAAVLASLVCYFAHTSRNKLQKLNN